MRNFKFIYLVDLCFCGLILVSCNKDQNHEPTADTQISVDVRSSPFITTISVTKESDYLVFNSFSDLDVFLSDANTASHEQLNSWENQKSFKSQRQMFYEVMNAETNLDLTLENLPEQAQLIEKNKTPYYSSEHNQALDAGLIRYYGDGANSYWDYSLVEPMLASAVNSNGLIKVGTQLIKYSKTNFIYIVKDGDISKLPLAISKTDDFENEDIKVIKTNPYNPEGTVTNHETEIRSLCFSLPHENTFSKTNGWRTTGKRRTKVEVNGRAKANFGSAQCVNGTTCTFQVRTQAQPKNFWGNWGFHSDFGPSCTISGATWSYNMSLMLACSDYATVYNNNNIIGGSHSKTVWNKFYLGQIIDSS